MVAASSALLMVAALSFDRQHRSSLAAPTADCHQHWVAVETEALAELYPSPTDRCHLQAAASTFHCLNDTSTPVVTSASKKRKEGPTSGWTNSHRDRDLAFACERDHPLPMQNRPHLSQRFASAGANATARLIAALGERPLHLFGDSVLRNYRDFLELREQVRLEPRTAFSEPIFVPQTFLQKFLNFTIVSHTPIRNLLHWAKPSRVGGAPAPCGEHLHGRHTGTSSPRSQHG